VDSILRKKRRKDSNGYFTAIWGKIKTEMKKSGDTKFNPPFEQRTAKKKRKARKNNQT